MSIFEILMLCIDFPIAILVLFLCLRMFDKFKKFETIIKNSAKRNLTKEEYIELLELINKF